jgi:sialidase-1
MKTPTDIPQESVIAEILETKIICTHSNAPHGPIQLRDGRLLVVYGHRREPFGERACISRDEGRTWDIEHEFVLADAPGPDLGYPSSVQLADDSILTVYYQAQRIGAPTCLMSTHWRLKQASR